MHGFYYEHAASWTINDYGSNLKDLIKLEPVDLYRPIKRARGQSEAFYMHWVNSRDGAGKMIVRVLAASLNYEDLYIVRSQNLFVKMSQNIEVRFFDKLKKRVTGFCI